MQMGQTYALGAIPKFFRTAISDLVIPKNFSIASGKSAEKMALSGKDEFCMVFIASSTVSALDRFCSLMGQWAAARF